ncbi:hypothetical protein E2C01_074409 [Portunus trituberculatus]|uniref:Uncharacterized protein n=1 Tax=Portunus trituberculatus TaxID=210409 RepID=A0A5B7ID38_PORTR|nr:hypothetical protein [Portunus trituberculatus]
MKGGGGREGGQHRPHSGPSLISLGGLRGISQPRRPPRTWAHTAGPTHSPPTPRGPPTLGALPRVTCGGLYTRNYIVPVIRSSPRHLCVYLSVSSFVTPAAASLLSSFPPLLPCLAHLRPPALLQAHHSSLGAAPEGPVVLLTQGCGLPPNMRGHNESVPPQQLIGDHAKGTLE